jgi:hypothetical protein
MAITATERTQIVELTVLMFNAAPGATYLSQIVGAYEADGHNLQTLAVQLGNTAAYQSLNPNFQLAADFATAFLTPLGLQTDSVAVSFVTSKFNAGESKGQIAYEAFTALNAVTSAYGPQYQNAKAILLNKTEVAEYYSEVKAVAETNLGALQNVLSTITADHATVTAEIAALNVVPPLLLNLTTGVDVVHAEVGNNSIVTGTADAAGTFTVGDVITGNATTVFNLSLNGTPTSLSTVTNVGTVNLNADASTTVNADLWSGIGSINVVTPTIAGTTTTISNAQVATVIGDYSGNQANLTVTYRDTSGSADTAHLALGGTGTSTAASAIDVSSGNTVEALAIGTSGTDFATINGGTKVKTITIAGTGADTFTFGTTAATLTVDASGTTASQKLTFAAGTIGSEDTITGGTGADTVTANSSTTFAHMTGVETFVTTVDGGVGLFDGANVSGLTTMTINQGTTAGSEIFSNMKAEFSTLNINGPTGSQEVDYVTGANAALAVNYGPGSTAYDTTFDGINVSGVKSLAVTFNVGGVAADAIAISGDVTLDKANTTSLTLINAGSDDSLTTTLDVKRADSLDNLVIRATGAASSMYVSVDIATPHAVQGLQTLEITASGASSYAAVQAWDYNGGTTLSTASNVMALTSVAITASGSSSYAAMYDYIYSIGDMDTYAISASGDLAVAEAYYYLSMSGDLGALSITASGASSTAYQYYGAYIYGALGTLDITASGVDSKAYVDSSVSVTGDIGAVTITASADGAVAYIYDGIYTSGSIGTVTLSASGVSATAHIDSMYVSGDVGAISITASGALSNAYIDTAEFYADVGSIAVTASGSSSDAQIELSTVSGDLGSLSFTASAHAADAYLYTTGVVNGNLGTLTMLASGSSSLAYFDGYTLTVGGNVNTINITASGKSAYADDYMYVSGNIGTLNVTASGAGSDAYAYNYTTDGSMTIAALNVAATGVNSYAYAGVTTGSGVLATVTMSSTKAGSDASLVFSGNTFGTVTATTGTATSSINMYLDSTTAAGGTISASGLGTLYVEVQEKSITSLSAGTMTGAVNFVVVDITKATTAMTITTGSGDDTVMGGAAADTFAVGAGNDTIKFTNVSADADVLVATAPTDTIASGFTSGGGTTVLDQIQIGYGAGSATNYAESLTDVTTFAAFVTAANTALNGTVQYYFGVAGGNGYLAYDVDGVGTTGIIKLTGVTDMAYQDITA